MRWLYADYTERVCEENETGVSGDTPTEEIVLHNDWERDDSISTTIIEGVAAVMDTPEAKLDPTLYEVVDPDALDDLCRPLNGDIIRDGSGQLKFSLQGCIVTLDWSGRITIGLPDES